MMSIIPFSMKSVNIWCLVLIIVLLVTAVSVSKKTHAVEIGQQYGGGIVFYIDESGQHGLVVTTSDLSIFHRGLQRRVFKHSWYDAKKACADHSVTVGEKTYSNWFLAEHNKQLKQLYVQERGCWGDSRRHALELVTV